MKSLIAEFTVRPEHADRMAEMVATLTEAVRSEPGCVLFVPRTRADNPLHYVVFEVYADESAFQQHLVQEHGAVFNSEQQRYIEEPESVLTFLDGDL